MNKFHSHSMKALALSASVIAFSTAVPAFAQDMEPGEDCLVDNVPGVVNADGDCVEVQEGPTGASTTAPDDVEIATGAQGETGAQSAITVTGSRIRRDTYSSISPLQVISTENQQSVGAFDPSQILQRSEAAAGTQIDATFQGFVLDNGPGSQTLNLRGLGADRTLLLVNGRRLAPAGVEGAPTVPSLNLIPATLVDRYDLLLDGASSIYGSDAVAGVGNLVLRKDFDGLELQANGNINPQGAGEDYTLSGSWGFNTDRGFFGIGAEYAVREEIQLRDRDFLSGCNTNLEVDQDGNILTVDVADNAIVQERSGSGISVAEDACKIQGISGRVFQPFSRLGSIYFPTNGNVANIPGLNFGDNSNVNGLDVDFNNDGIRDVDFRNVNNNAANLDQTFVSGQDLINVFTYGEYTIPGAGNVTPYFEANYSRAEISLSNTGLPQLFPFVPGDNPTNPCALVNADCRAADNAFQLASDPDVFTRDEDGDGVADLNPLSTGFNLPTQPIVTIRGDRNNVQIVQEQYRGVFGVRGDLPFIGSSWAFDVSGVYSRSEGSSTRDGIREDRLALAIGVDPTADFDGDGIADDDGDGVADDYDANADFFSGTAGICADPSTLANPDLAAPDLAQGCVPVNLFADSVLGATIGDFATQAERDYLFDQRSFDTTYEQIVLNAFVTGDLFDLPAGPVGVVLGGEFRDDTIDSQPNSAASNGLYFGFFADGGASGSRNIYEGFGEIDIPVVAGEPLVEELNVNLSGRITKDEFYGTNGTYSVKGGWRPVAPLLFKISYGTSFRAPNLRELYLRNQSGFQQLNDPCAVPEDAFLAGQGGYQEDLETRDAIVLENCRREGRDPTMVGINEEGLNTASLTSVELTSGGVIPLGVDLDPETSTSITTGFAFEESFASGFGFAFNFNYYDIQLRNSIIEPGGQFILNDCYTREDGTRSQFCDRITASGQGRMLVSNVLQGFLNLDAEAVRGLDFNTTMNYPLIVGNETFDLSLNAVANHLIERSNLFTNDNGSIEEEDFAGEFGFPSWTGRLTGAVDWNDFRLTYQVRYVSDIEQDPDGINPFADAFGNGPDGSPALNDLGDGPFFGDTCTGGGSPGDLAPGASADSGAIAGDGVFCRDVGFVDEWFEHTVSLRYDNDTIRIIAGITNLFDTAPPLIDTAEVFGVSNIPIGNPYNIDGREFFAQVLYRF